MADLEQFRAETRSWLEANCPPEMRKPVEGEEDVYWGGRNATFKNDAQKAWFEACRDKGYTVPAWPTAYGGAGLSPAEAKVLREEMARINAPRRSAASVSGCLARPCCISAPKRRRSAS